MLLNSFGSILKLSAFRASVVRGIDKNMVKPTHKQSKHTNTHVLV